MRLWIQGSAAPRPQAVYAAFLGPRANGPGVEISQRPGNQTPRQLRADTLTAICLRFSGPRADLAVADRLDGDTVLALLVLQDTDLARGHRRTLAQAAEMAAHQGWGDSAAQELFQGLALLLAELREKGMDPSIAAGRCVDRARTLLVPSPRAELAAGLKALRRSVSLIDRGDVRRRPVSPRFVLYDVPFALAGKEALYVPAQGEPISEACLLWPHARARLDRERVTQITVGAPGGWTHEVWYPGYCWCDAPDSWRPPGLEDDGRFAHVPLSAALLRLQALETGEGTWKAAQRLAPGEKLGERGFPVAAAFLAKDGTLAASTIAPEQVAQVIGAAF
jgi:hypothetical protein